MANEKDVFTRCMIGSDNPGKVHERIWLKGSPKEIVARISKYMEVTTKRPLVEKPVKEPKAKKVKTAKAKKSRKAKTSAPELETAAA